MVLTGKRNEIISEGFEDSAIKSSTTFARYEIGTYCTAGMPFAIGIPLGGTHRLTSYCPKDSYGERSETKWSEVEIYSSISKPSIIKTYLTTTF